MPYVKLVRPKQFIKNFLLAAVPIAAGRFFELEIFLLTIIAIIIFSLAASGIYILNDFLDKDLDKLHATKKHRPLASGSVSAGSAIALSIILITLSLIFSYFFINSNFILALILYLIIQTFYLLKAKNLHTLEIFIVASGFVIRSLSGGLATEIVITPWFNVLIATTAIFIVSAKRYSEFLASSNFDTRLVLKRYTASYLRTIWETALTSSVILYTLWTFNLRDEGFDIYSLLSIIPFYLMLLLYAKKTDFSDAEAPEEVFYKDKNILALSFIWLVIIFLRGISLN